MNLVFKKLGAKTLKNAKADYAFFELKDYLDFEVKRMYYINNCQVNTGEHCHKIEKELFVMQIGSCVAIIDQGKGKEDILLAPGDAVYIGNYVWHGFKDFSADAILLALSSTNYSPDRSDYIEDYDEYQKIVQAG
ncbi:MAG: hypothetical protein A3J93_00925 [Candidatus Magasanikbacteria bacterium RIFOXYC2_FULL_42_28]|uniref:Sugar 3,4-ketoisomerase QdtA cupin domain-containing protein n=1 Tax=Candidatus Magasanikbacteria bacterium RIFOXYC2_FULL_42_28 TaxID=1798704 RepID=A0A1F6NXJ3_9BACT|nr:MAG: hypothetical protein A3J93_00925 [Candidatus Magasanikbacteria bacterium RIFOXYC2_FULL_42_28]